MKKILFVFLAVIGLAFVSCGTKTAETETVVGDTTMAVVHVDTNVCADTVVADIIE